MGVDKFRRQLIKSVEGKVAAKFMRDDTKGKHSNRMIFEREDGTTFFVSYPKSPHEDNQTMRLTIRKAVRSYAQSES